MNIVVNGRDMTVPEAYSVLDLARSLGLDPERVAVERNRNIVCREEFAATRLEEGDRLEMLQFVGGG